MTTHLRRQIREATATAVTGLATTGSRVYQSRMRPQGDAALPCLLVLTGSETIKGFAQAQQDRELDIQIIGLVKASVNLDDVLDQIALEVEPACWSAGTLGGLLASGLMLAGIDVDFDDSLDKPVGRISLSFKGMYYTRAGSPGAVA